MTRQQEEPDYQPVNSSASGALIAGVPPFLITVGLVEAAFFINVAFMALFVFATPGMKRAHRYGEPGGE